MGLEFKMKSINILDDLEAELSKKLNLKISFEDLEDEESESKEENESKEG